MNYPFNFTASESVLTYCEEILDLMQERFEISFEEALGRINEAWGGRPFWSEELIFHETSEFWAYDIYYGHDSGWWQKPPELKALPYPK
jgi:hypothetical protein